MNNNPRALLRAMFDAAIAAALPDKTLPAYLPKPPQGRTLVIGCGKAAGSMAKAVEDHWPGELSGMVVTVTVTTCRRNASKSSKLRIRCPTKPGAKQPSAC